MILSSKYKRFKRNNFTGDTFTPLDMRSLIIRTIEGHHSHTNTADLKRLEKEAQIKEIDTPKTDRITAVSDRALLALPYAIMIAWLGGFVGRAQGVKKPKTYLIIEIIPFLVFYSYATKYHNLASMFVPGYRCSNVYINVEKRALMNKDIQ